MQLSEGWRRKHYDAKSLTTAADMLNDRVLPIFEAQSIVSSR